MNNGVTVIYGECNEDGPFSALHRVTSLSGTGAEKSQGEGPVIKVADVSAITCKVYEIAGRDEAPAAAAISPDPTLTSANVFDTLRTAGWKSDLIGYNFRHDVAAIYVADPGEWRLIEYKITLTDGSVIFLEYRIKTRAKATS